MLELESEGNGFLKIVSIVINWTIQLGEANSFLTDMATISWVSSRLRAFLHSCIQKQYFI